MSIPENEFLSDVVNDMPDISSAAPIIAEKFMDATKGNDNDEKTGTEKKRGPGRPKKDPNAPSKSSKNTSRLGAIRESEQDRLEASLAAQRIAAAAFVVSMVEMSGLAVGGNEARMVDGEKENMINIYDAYFKAKNIADIPPGVALALITGQYYARVLSTPKAKPKIIGFVMKIKNKMKGLKNARFGGGNDRERENDTRKNDGDSVQEKRD